LMPLARDFAFLVDRAAKAGDLIKAVRGAATHFSELATIANVTVFDLYEGAGVPAGKKSVGVAVTLQPREKTLTDPEIDAAAQAIIAEAANRTGAVLRG
ncbi:MAG: phenylalanine--tRNA ligase subunit beta, partial [Methylocystis sp.]|nr:phenylalanine--tRNA ligase subunit beta [Methylocystis sp.]